ncbi:MAG: metal ABC transporter permease [Candidatus Sericytochromatia bacterium]|nr:metal ABC transporter permease [Candidatus Sericytochromatia bacterium]
MSELNVAPLSLAWEALTLPYAFMRYSLAGTALVGAACGLLGCFIILRRLSLFGDALGHAVFPGVMLASFLGAGHLGVFLGALAAGLAAAALVAWIPSVTRHRADTAMGVVFTGFFGLGVALLTLLPVGTHRVATLMFGRALGVGPADVLAAAGVLLTVLLFITLAFRPLALATFDPVAAGLQGVRVGLLTVLLMVLLTATVVVSLPIVGAVLVVALLVIPAATASLLVDRLAPMLALAALLGLLAAEGGLVMSHVWGWASGASMVLASAAYFLLALGWSQGRRRWATGGLRA